MYLIIIGLLFVLGGLGSWLGIAPFRSPDLVAAIGAVMIVWGFAQIRRRRRAQAEFIQAQEDRNPSPEFTPPNDDA